MQILCLSCAFVQLLLAELTMAQSTDPPEWGVPSPAVESFTITSSQCSEITELIAASRDGDSAVVYRATNDGGNGLSSDIHVTINFSDQVTGPTWSSGTSYSLDKSDCTVCDPAATLSASSSDSTSVTYSLVSQSPDGGFSVSGNTMSCTYASITPATYTVVVRAQNTGNGGTADQKLTIAVTAASGGGPSWPTETSYTVNKSVSTDCSPAVSLSATSSDCSSVAYSFVSESSSGGFSVTGSTLSCTLASLDESSYTVVVRATNTGDGAHTDHTLTITVTSEGSEESDSGDNGNNGTTENNGWKYGLGFGVPCGLAFLAGCGFAAYKVCKSRNGKGKKYSSSNVEGHTARL